MTATLIINNTEDLTELQWPPMVALSGFVHLIVFIIILFVPGSIPQGRNITGIVYEVDLVEMPSSILKNQESGTVVKEKGTAIVEKDSQARRISEPMKESTPISVAKKSVEKKSTTVKKLSSSQLIDNAISKIEKKVITEEENHVDKAISKLEKKVGKNDDQGSAGGWSLNGITIRIYQMEVETRIKGNWSFPVEVLNRKDIEATVIIKVSQDGTILNYQFKDSSSDAKFDESVLKAIEKSDPLPTFPEGYRKNYDEIEINFNLKDLQDS
jgi:TonB family protein